jgi:DNA-binding transcriptional ArsR family regulator
MQVDTQGGRIPPAPGQVALAVEIFSMLADPTRVRLVCALLDGEMSVNQLADALDKASTTVSQHLAKLRMARLVRARRQGNQVFYRIENEHVRQLVEDSIRHTQHTAVGAALDPHPDGDLVTAAP